MEDSSQQNKSPKPATTHTSPSRSGQQTFTGAKPNDKTQAAEKTDNRNSTKDDKRSGAKWQNSLPAGGIYASSAKAQGKPSPPRTGSRSLTSKDGSTKKDNTSGDYIILSDDDDSPPSLSSKRRRSRDDKQRKHSRSRSRSGHKIRIRDERHGKRSLSISRSRSGHRVVVKDYRWHRQVHRSSSKGRRSRSRDKRRSRSGSRKRRLSQGRRRSRSRSIGRTSRHRSKSVERSRRHLRHKSASPGPESGELQSLKQRIKKLKAEIAQTKMEKDDYVRHHEELKAEISRTEMDKGDYLQHHDELNVEVSPSKMLEDAYLRHEEELKAEISRIEMEKKGEGREGRGGDGSGGKGRDDYLLHQGELNADISGTKIDNDDYLQHHDKLKAEISQNRMVADYVWRHDEQKAEIGQTEIGKDAYLWQAENSRATVEKDDYVRHHDDRIYDVRNVYHVPPSAVIEQYLADIRQTHEHFSQAAADTRQSQQRVDYPHGASVDNKPHDVARVSSEVPPITARMQLTPPPQPRLVFVLCI